MKANLNLHPPSGCSDNNCRNPINIAHRLFMGIVIKEINFLWVAEGKHASYTIHSGRLGARWTVYAALQEHPRQALYV
jgi:hypothetical protein